MGSFNYSLPTMSIATIRAAAYALPVLAFAALPVFAASTSAHDDEIARVERGLRTPVVVAGEPAAPRALLEEMRRLHVPGVSIALIRNGKIAWTRGYGVVYEGGPAVTPDTLFQAASISKPVTAMAALRLAERGELDLDADINTVLTTWHLPPGPGAGNTSATVRQLLSHTAGTSVSGFPGYAADKPVPTLVQVLDGAPPANTKPVRIVTVPGSAWRYSGGGYTIVQQALIDRSGKPFDALLLETVLKPAGMADSRFAQPLPASLLGRAALPHDEAGQPYAGGPHTYPELAAAGLWTTPADLARFALDLQRSLQGGKGVLSPRMARTMIAPVDNRYGLGLQIEGEGQALSFAHGGSNMGYQNTLFAYARHGDGAVVMTNGANGGELANSVLRALAAEYKWPSQQPTVRKAVALELAAQEKLAGRYLVPGQGDFTIARRDGQLMVALRGAAWEPLYAAAPDVLFVLSRKLELQMAGDGGRLVSGSFDLPFKRAE
jgi:CubicO group peptidase (beta-lactamase class C family)